MKAVSKRDSLFYLIMNIIFLILYYEIGSFIFNN